MRFQLERAKLKRVCHNCREELAPGTVMLCARAGMSTVKSNICLNCLEKYVEEIKEVSNDAHKV
jgi:hypothetical protein